MADKKPQKVEVQTPQEIEALLAANLENNDKNHKITHDLLAGNLEHAEKTRNEHTLLAENQLEMEGKTQETIKENGTQVAEAINKISPGIKELLETSEFLKRIVALFKGDKGDKGDDGKTPKRGQDYLSDEELNKIKEEIRPKKAQDYFTPEEVEKIKKEITPIKGVHYKDGYTPIKGKDYKDGEDGENAEPVDKEDIVKEVIKRIPKPKEVKPFSIQEILKEIKGKFSYRDLKDAPDFNPTFPKLAGTGFLREISDVNTQGLKVGQVLQWNGTYWVPVTPSTSSGGSFTPLQTASTVNSSNTLFVFSTATAQPTLVISDGIQYQQQDNNGDNQWTYNTGTKTVTLITISAPTRSIFAIQ